GDFALLVPARRVLRQSTNVLASREAGSGAQGATETLHDGRRCRACFGENRVNGALDVTPRITRRGAQALEGTCRLTLGRFEYVELGSGVGAQLADLRARLG